MSTLAFLPGAPAMRDVPLWRLHLLRATYLLISVGLALTFGPALLAAEPGWAQRQGATAALLGGVACLSVLGLRYPLQMLPVLMFEGVWKLIWLLAVGVPLWHGGHVTPALESNTVECIVGVVLVAAVLPWRHVWRQYVRQAAEPWRRPAAGG